MLFQFGFWDAGISAVVFQIAVGYQFIEVLQTDWVFDQKNLVVGAELEGVGFLGHLGDQLFVGTYILLVQVSDHAEIDGGQHGGIVAGAMVVEVAQIIMGCHRIQLVILQIGEEETG